MSSPASFAATADRPRPRRVLELLKPITWFAPMWAFGCGVVSSGAAACAATGSTSCSASRSPGRWSAAPARPSTTGSIAMSMPSTSLAARSPRAGCRDAGASIIAQGWTAAVADRRDRRSASGRLPPRPRRPGARLGLQRTALAVEAQWLVGQRRRRRLLRGAALVHRRGDHGRRPARLAHHSRSPRSTAPARTAS